jgi:hypothetical protein
VAFAYADAVLSIRARADAEMIATDRLLKNLRIAAKYDARKALKGAA